MTVEWPVLPLSSLVSDELRNGVFKKKTEFGKGTLLVNVSDVFRKLKVNTATLDRVLVSLEEQARFSAQPGDLLFVRSSLKREGLAYSCVVENGTEPIVFECHLIRARPDLAKIVPLFLAYFTHSLEFRREVMSHAKTVAITTIGQDALGGVPVRVPPLGEQRKIAAILSSVDEAIEATQAVIDQLHVVKKAMMAELLTRGLPGRHTRFKQTEIGEVPEEWEVVQLCELVHPDTSITYGIVQAGPHVQDGIPYIRTGDVKPSGIVSAEKLGRTSVEIASKFDRSRVRTGDLVFCIRASVGAVASVPSELDGANLTQGTARIAPGPRVLSQYLIWALRSQGVQDWVGLQCKGSTFREITLGRLRELPTPVPTAEEQARIGSALDGVETRLRAEEQAREGLSLVKAALMSVLLTGEVRVKPDEEAA